MSLPPIVPPIIRGERCPHCLGAGSVIDQRGLGKLLRERRTLFGYTQTAVADAIGISKAYLSDLENGRRDWPDRVFSAYVQVMWEAERA